MLHKPFIDKAWLESDFPPSKLEYSSFWWFPYPLTLQVQRPMKVDVRDVEFKLAVIAEEALELITLNEDASPAALNPQRALELYDAIID